MEKQNVGQWWRTLRPLFWWGLIVLGLFGYHEHQLWLARTRLQFSVTLNGQPLTFGVETKLDGQPIFTGQNISLGSHIFTISHPKAEPYGTKFSAWYGSNGLGEIKLKRSQGTLNVLAVPTAGTITITGPEFSTNLNDVAATNLLVPTDAYQIRADYPHWTESKNVTVFNQMTVACVFSPQFGALHLTCNRDGATYVLQFENGQSADSGNLPATVTGLPSGNYQMSAAYHHRQIEKSVVLAAGVTNEVPLEFALGAARLESVPAGADVQAADGSDLGQTPLDLTDLPPQTAQYNLSLLGYEPVSVRVAIVADQTTTMHTNLLSVRFGEALSETRQFLSAGNNEKALQAAMEALGIKADDATALALQATATDNLKAARQRMDADQQRADAERQQAESARKSLERLKRPRMVFDALCGQNPDATLFSEHEIKTSKPAKEVEAAIVKSLQVAPLAYQISSDGLQQPETYAVTAQETFSLGFLGGTERVCLLVVGQTKDDETQILFKVIEYQIKHTLVDLKDEKELIPMHPSRMEMNEINQAHVQTGIRLVTERIQAAIGQ